jgi:DNA-binding CsgD family transcriptional regulator
VSAITRLALASDCRSTFRSRALLAIGERVPFSRGAWVEAPAFGGFRTEVSPAGSRRPHALGTRPPGLLCLELQRFGRPRATLVLEREDREFSAEEVQLLAGLLPTLLLADEGTGAANGPARALSLRESEIVEYVRLGYTNAQIALATGRSVAAVRNLLVRIFDKTGVRSRAQLVGGPVATRRLTPRERDVVQQLRTGLTNREIGRALGISINTVRNTLARIFEKVGVSTRSELMGALADEGRSPG